MKNNAASRLIWVLILTARFGARADVLFSEAFPVSYGDGTLLGANNAVGGFNTKWSAGNSAGTGSALSTSAAALEFAALAPVSAAPSLGLRAATATSRRLAAPFIAQSGDGNAAYLSFLLKVTAATPADRQLVGLRNSTGSGNLAAAVGISASRQLTLFKNSSVASATHVVALNPNETYLIVMRLRFQSGADEVALWLNPQTGESDEIDAGVTPLTTTANSDQSSVLSLQLPSVSDASGGLYMDEIRVATTWAEATPASGSPLQPQPRITEAFFAGDGFVLRGTNGTPAGAYQVLSSTNLQWTADDWISTATNFFDPGGNFDCTNPIPAIEAARWFRLLVGGSIPPTAPSITTEPTDVTVIAGQNASFSVVATGAAPLAYQWHANTVAVSGATASSFTVTNAQTSDTGGYHVVVTNSVGSVTSRVAALSVVQSPVAGTPDGYATLNGNTTGGKGGATVTANDLADFSSFIGDDVARVVLVQGTINLGDSNVRVRDNKTILGVGTNAMLVGNLKVYGNTNVILQNLIFTNPNGVGDGDGLTLQDCRNIWVDHCTFVDCDDGSLDISHAADWITVSWCHFYYTNPANTHRFSNLVGHSDNNAAEDAGKLHVTFHHNWWGQLVHERMPRVRFGRVHCYNNFYDAAGNNNCIRAAIASEILVENNYFNCVKNVWELYRTQGVDGKVFASGNMEVNTTWSAGSDSSSIQIPGTDVLSVEANGLNPPPYAYGVDVASSVPTLVTAGAGAGSGPFAP